MLRGLLSRLGNDICTFCGHTPEQGLTRSQSSKGCERCGSGSKETSLEKGFNGAKRPRSRNRSGWLW